MSSNENFKLFVYGTLRSGFNKNAAYEYIAQYFQLLGEARVKGKLYDLGEYPAAIETDEDFYITGELYQAANKSKFDYVIAQLDDYEGVTVEVGEEQLYKRRITTVITPEGETEAWMYWYNGEVDEDTFVASGDILEYLRNKSK